MNIQKVHIEPSTDFSVSVITAVFADYFGRDFVLWKGFQSKNEKWLKSPVSSHGYRVDHLERSNRFRLKDAINKANSSGSGVGVSFGKSGLSTTTVSQTATYYLYCFDGDGFADLDSKDVDAGVSDLVKKLETYVEGSPSGTGFKIFLLSDRPPRPKEVFDFSPSVFAERHPGISKYHNRQIEVFSQGAYMALTGRSFCGEYTFLKLNVISKKCLEDILEYLDAWAKNTGGSGLRKTAASQNKTDVESVPSIEYTKLTEESLSRVLAHIDSDDEQDWSDTANALARVYGDKGRGWFHQYSSGELQSVVSEKYNVEECNRRFDRALAELVERPDGLGVKSLVAKAMRSTTWDHLTPLDFNSNLPFSVEGSSSGQQVLITSQVNRTSGGNHKGDIANGKLFACMYRDRIIYIQDLNIYLMFDDQKGWSKVDPPFVMEAAKNVVGVLQSQLNSLAQADPQNKEITALASEIRRVSMKNPLNAMVELGRAEPGMWANSKSFDSDPYLLGVQNGVVDLRLGALLKSKPDLRVSKRTNVAFDPDAICPLFLSYLSKVLPDNDVRRFLQRYVGYLLTGEVIEHKFIFFYGLGRNGKTVLIELLGFLLGDYAVKLQTELLMKHTRSTQQASPDLMKLRGARFAYCSETTEGRMLDDARVKELSGGDTIIARPLYSSEVSFSPTHKLLMVGNHKPIITDNSEGLWRRMVIMPFNHTISDDESDPKLQQKLRVEASGILNWAMAGVSAWIESGLDIPDQLLGATKEYRQDQDVLNDWLMDCCDLGDSYKTPASILYQSFENWCRCNNYKVMTSKSFGRKLKEHGYELAPDNRNRLGIKIAGDDLTEKLANVG
jgi:P4 family phage/plasmid primase-like protien